jgi:hypothetical protein
VRPELSFACRWRHENATDKITRYAVALVTKALRHYQ